MRTIAAMLIALGGMTCFGQDTAATKPAASQPAAGAKPAEWEVVTKTASYKGGGKKVGATLRFALPPGAVDSGRDPYDKDRSIKRSGFFEIPSHGDLGKTYLSVGVAEFVEGKRGRDPMERAIGKLSDKLLPKGSAFEGRTLGVNLRALDQNAYGMAAAIVAAGDVECNGSGWRQAIVMIAPANGGDLVLIVEMRGSGSAPRGPDGSLALLATLQQVAASLHVP